MPPKAAKDNAKKQKAVEDKTFGLKNKNKSKQVQKYIKSVQQNAGINKNAEKNAEEKKAKKDAQKAAQQQALLLGLAGSIGEARKATKKKPASQKIDLYQDQRAQKGDEKEKDKGMEDWTQEKLEEVVMKKANKVTTDIICKHFLEAVEKRLYGWFWTCPNGGDTCKYKHSLPPGFVLKSSIKKDDDEEEEEEQTIEELIEIERKALPPGGTPVTLETLKAWKIRKEAERQAQMEEDRKAEAKKTGGKGLHVMSGRDLFTFDPTLFQDADGAASEYEEEEGSDEEQDDTPIKEIKEMVSEMKVDPAVPIKEELFLAEGDIPDDLDNLDD